MPRVVLGLWAAGLLTCVVAGCPGADPETVMASRANASSSYASSSGMGGMAGAGGMGGTGTVTSSTGMGGKTSSPTSSHSATSTSSGPATDGGHDGGDAGDGGDGGDAGDASVDGPTTSAEGGSTAHSSTASTVSSSGGGSGGYGGAGGNGGAGGQGGAPSTGNGPATTASASSSSGGTSYEGGTTNDCVTGSGELGTPCGSGDSVCDGNGNCVTDRFVFVTSEVFSPAGSNTVNYEFDSPDSANVACKMMALSSSLNFYSDATWIAWLSTDAIPASNVINPNVRWFLAGSPNTQVAGGLSDLINGNLGAAIQLDENGDEVVVVPLKAWTGSTKDGGADKGNTCMGWSSANGMADVGDITSNKTAWTSSGTLDCTAAAHLYCFLQ